MPTGQTNAICTKSRSKLRRKRASTHTLSGAWDITIHARGKRKTATTPQHPPGINASVAGSRRKDTTKFHSTYSHQRCFCSQSTYIHLQHQSLYSPCAISDTRSSFAMQAPKPKQSRTPTTSVNPAPTPTLRRSPASPGSRPASPLPIRRRPRTREEGRPSHGDPSAPTSPPPPPPPPASCEKERPRQQSRRRNACRSPPPARSPPRGPRERRRGTPGGVWRPRRPGDSAGAAHAHAAPPAATNLGCSPPSGRSLPTCPARSRWSSTSAPASTPAPSRRRPPVPTRDCDSVPRRRRAAAPPAPRRGGGGPPAAAAGWPPRRARPQRR